MSDRQEEHPMPEITSASSAPAAPVARRRRFTAAVAAVITALFGSGLVAFVLAQPSSATTVPGPPAAGAPYSVTASRARPAPGQLGELEVRHRPRVDFRHRRDRDHDQLDQQRLPRRQRSPGGQGDDSGGAWTSGRIQTNTANVGAPAGGELEVTASVEQPNPASGLGYSRRSGCSAPVPGQAPARSTSSETSMRCPSVLAPSLRRRSWRPVQRDHRHRQRA